ncbi:hypothetical protein [Marinomonas rhodophyticola]|uniref:Uncharacterized protein n=1 Tax=Marinomonas rhodophyticola TaxID=2992803 RepID=A0ABT3KAH7_9GAMM|nr:hypothetical protein [Marinomonas sp. KJ51-3]MCW4627530.1 hypothetical protein [Marinomonas sp. KJ51-3]
MLSTHVCAFSSKVAKSYLEPAAHLHIAYPSYVETSEVRQAVRVETRLICNLVSILLLTQLLLDRRRLL